MMSSQSANVWAMIVSFAEERLVIVVGQNDADPRRLAVHFGEIVGGSVFGEKIA